MNESLDSAAVFACAKSLYDACLERKNSDPEFKIAEAYPGMDSVMRLVMRVANIFETWACRHVAFHETIEVWPYFLEEHFGDACLDFLDADSIGRYDEDDCFRAALRLRLPMKVDGSLPLPVFIELPNPAIETEFQRLRIQTVRQEMGEQGGMVPFTEDDDPFDEDFGTPIFGIYGVRSDGCLEHIADRESYYKSRALLVALLPGIDVPEEVVAFVNRDTGRDAGSDP